VASEDVNVEQIMLDEARIEVSYADHKASMVLAALGIGLGAVLGGVVAGDWKPADQDGLGEPVWWVGGALAVLSVVLAAGAVWPRYSRHRAGDGVYYWGDVAKFKSVDQLSQHLDVAAPAPGDRTRHQLWELSRIVSKKYALIRWAFIAIALAVAAFGLSAIISA
jgi:Family of unknown function (DUF5706)